MMLLLAPLALFPYVAIAAPQTFLTTPTRLAHPCDSLIHLKVENATILKAEYVPAGSKTQVPGSCQSEALNLVDLCRVYGLIETSASSEVKFEVWLPDTWYGRVLSTGNGGLNGCIDYPNLDYGTSLHFATIGSDGGHDGFTALPLLHHPEVLNDFSYRSIHAALVTGKLVVEAYYSKTPARSYYLGCSAGGRQGYQSALLYPEDFDGIVAGAPAVDWNRFAGAISVLATYVGAPEGQKSDRYITHSQWNLITREILKQCDTLDALADGIVAEPDECNFDPAALLCAGGQTENCLTGAQVNGLRLLYSPIYGSDGQEIWPRFDPGSELDRLYQVPMISQIHPMTEEWYRNTIYNDTHHNFDKFGVADMEFAQIVDPAGISTWSGDFSAFRDRGGKLLTYHGRSDALIPSGNSKRLYNLISSTLSMSTLDSFYRLFQVPGMHHCELGGAWAFGQGALVGSSSNVINDTDHNILLALVDWVERDVAPEHVIGLDNRLLERKHCRYPSKSLWNGQEWICKSG